MVLYKDKVYNIQIRYQEESQVYLLGTGLRGKEVRTSRRKTPPGALFMPLRVTSYGKLCSKILWVSTLYGNFRVKSH